MALPLETDTQELRRIVKEKIEARTRPTDLSALGVGALFVVVLSIWGFTAADNDRFPVDASRWMMAAGAVLSAVTTTTIVGWVLDRRSKRRCDEILARQDAKASVLCHLATSVGELAAQVEQLDQRVARVRHEGWPSADRERLLAELARAGTKVEPEEVEVPANVRDLTKEAFRLALRTRRADES